MVMVIKMNLICKLLGHKAKQYLQVSDCPQGVEWFENGKRITKKFHTYFLCSRCYQRYKQTETYFTEEKTEDEKKGIESENKKVKSAKDSEPSKEREAHLKAVPSCSKEGNEVKS